MQNPLAGRDLVSISDVTKEEIQLVLKCAEDMRKRPRPALLKGKILASCFFEPSTRTRLSFETAMLRLGGANIGFADGGITSARKGETLFDAMKVIGSYADLIVLRHPQEGSARLAAEAAGIPVINAGDGANQHPTQTLIDLFTIRECQGKIEDLHIALVGDLKYGRTIHSLSLALSHAPVRLYFVAPESLHLPDSITHELKKKGVKFSFHEKLEEVVPKVDVLYMSRIQKERFPEMAEGFANPCRLKMSHLEKAKSTLKILHPLPRVDEIEGAIDATPFAYYHQQAAHGVVVRMALLALILDQLDLSQDP
ncbi:MAG: aspartate carbamoyltransferase [Verrucomicrobia bacterium]|nr:aspartate carbamoyltransferase [Verrucomicrobiota bacterium]MBU6447024.1 aspartate carbamoyltransferase [Verrucomicrobiota bacterium]MDE3047206.1 aspartate carbamoyltransferase [Verrucomicrobiota bacterium]